MASDTEIKAKFWKSLKSDRTMFLGLAEGQDGHARPMTAQLDDDGFQDGQYEGPIWFFTSRSSELYQHIGSGGRAMAHFASKGMTSGPPYTASSPNQTTRQPLTVCGTASLLRGMKAEKTTPTLR